jgi:hypothetical protein
MFQSWITTDADITSVTSYTAVIYVLDILREAETLARYLMITIEIM